MTAADDLRTSLPYLRRFARALSGSQEVGDALVRATLEAIVADPDTLDSSLAPGVALYKVFHRICESGRADVAPDRSSDSGTHKQAQERLLRITPLRRQVLLLTALEEFSLSEVAEILDATKEEVKDLHAEAVEEIEKAMRTSILIIEDEVLISSELEQIVTGMGHTVSGTARTHRDAVEEARKSVPGLVLADIELADGSSGIDAVDEILGHFDIPVIFVTAYPELLLTGERPEPTYLITKPFRQEAIASAISQALVMHEEISAS